MANPNEPGGPPSQPRLPSYHAVGSGTGPATEPPNRVHLIIALVAGFALIAVPLVLWLRPSSKNEPEPALDAGAEVVADAAEENPTETRLLAALDGGVRTEKMELGKVWIDKCERPGPGRTPADQCDRQSWFEEALVRAILENGACAPDSKRGGTVSVAMRVDYTKRQIKVFAGKSGSIRGRSAANFVKCVRQSIPDPEWSSLQHDHTKYIVAVMVTFPGA